ncbi:hypothetical protein Emag_006101 [Eimeria magna]
MASPEDIDAFFDALVEGASADEEQQQQQQGERPLLLQQQQQQQREQQRETDEAPSGGAPSAGGDSRLPHASAAAATIPQPPAAAAAHAEAASAGAEAGSAQTSESPAVSDPGAAAATVGTGTAAAAAAGAVAGATAPGVGLFQASLFAPPDKQFPGMSPHPALLQRPRQRLQRGSCLGVPPELNPEPPYAYQPYAGTEEGRLQSAADAEAHTAAICSSALAVSRLIESKLKENEQLLFAVHENMTVGRYDEALCYFERLQQNLLFLAMLADQHRGGPTEASLEVQQQNFNANRDFWSHEELQRLHHALRTPGQDLQQLAAAVGSKSSAQILSYLSHAADRHLMHRAAAGPLLLADATAGATAPAATAAPAAAAAPASGAAPVSATAAAPLSAAAAAPIPAAAAAPLLAAPAAPLPAAAVASTPAAAAAPLPAAPNAPLPAAAASPLPTAAAAPASAATPAAASAAGGAAAPPGQVSSSPVSQRC